MTWNDASKVFEGELNLPRFQRIQQEFPRPQVPDIAQAVNQTVEALPEISERCSGKRIAITAGSRGISQIPEILTALVRKLRAYGADPFIVPAMGSHGGATAEGQVLMLANLGMTEESLGAPILSSMEAVQVGSLPNGMPVYIDKIAAQAEGIVIANRVKPHTDFTGDFESGLAKMAVLGLGKQKGAAIVHSYGVEGLRELMPQAARLIVQKTPVLFGLATVENAYHEVARIEAVPPQGIGGNEEKELLKKGYELMPRFPFPEIDVLIVEEMGKNISGVGMDPKVIGRVKVHGVPDLAPCDIRAITVLDLTPQAHGNASGIGLADVTTRHLVEQIDFEALYVNCVTAGVCGIQRSFIPMVAPDDRAAILTALRVCGQPDPLQARMVRIKNTLSLGEIDISERLRRQIKAGETVKIISESFPLMFNEEGRLRPFEQASGDENNEQRMQWKNPTS
jgi:hypothetical protein